MPWYLRQTEILNMKYQFIILLLAFKPITVFSEFHPNKALIRSTPHISLTKNESVYNKTLNITTYKLSKEKQQIQLKCDFFSPHQWRWVREEFDLIKITAPKIITKQKIRNRTESGFISTLTITLDPNVPVETNFSCSLVNQSVEPMTACVEIVFTENETVLRVFNELPIKKCLSNINLTLDTVSHNCSSNLTINLQKMQGKCKQGELGIVECSDLDTCDTYLSTNFADDACNKGIFGNISSGGSIIAPPINRNGAPIIVYCSKRFESAYWTSFTPLYPMVKTRWSEFSYRFYEIQEDKHYKNSIQLYALHIYENFSNISQLRNMHIRSAFADGESVQFVCVAVKYLFMKGFKLKLGNITLTPLESELLDIRDRNKTTRIETADILYIVQTNITLNSSKYGTLTNASCVAPIWNSRSTVVSSLNVTLFPATLPHTKVECDDSAGNEISCSCSMSGWPKPTFTWIPKPHNSTESTELDKRSKESTHPHNRSWIVKGKYMKNRTSINIICNAQNFMGNATDSYNYIPGFEIGLIVSIVVSSACIVFVATAIYMYWRYRKRVLMYAEQKQSLTIEEIEEFYKGASQTSTDYEALLLPYNSEEYEIPKEKLTLDGTVLGSGQFGVVLRGNIGQLPVAVKTIKPTADLIYFKSLLTELKILQFVGPHRHIVNLIGANTTNIRKREVFLVLDYCANGNLINFLRNCRPKFVNFFNDCSNENTTFPIYENACHVVLTTSNLLRFATEIAIALNHLASKNVIHGDLAARNVLVTEELHVKICDFGLSKQLLHYTVYVQKIDCPLPLRWMALESLQDMEFSLASDRWSYGIVLYELFSLGELPYPGEQWSFESYRMLQEGYRMAKPKYANDSIYRLMLELWDAKPQARPTFECIISQLKREEELLT